MIIYVPSFYIQEKIKEIQNKIKLLRIYRQTAFIKLLKYWWYFFLVRKPVFTVKYEIV